MSRQKISEHTAKQLLYPAFHLTYSGQVITQATTAREIIDHFGDQNLVVKVDQGIKKRGKHGLVKVNITPKDVLATVKSWAKLDWTQFLAEPVVEHDESAERYLALERTRGGWNILYSTHGGVDIESNWSEVSSAIPTKLKNFLTSNIIPILDHHHIAFIEMNPIIVRSDKIIPLDMAVEVDNAGSLLPILLDRALAPSEVKISELDSSTPASLKFRLINPEGRIWMLLSGGGASLVLADEVADLGLGSELANYGEYSGAPTDDDVYSYTKIILSQLLGSKNNKRKALIIAGGVANFTDVAKTFRGLIRALDEQKNALKQSKVKVYVRRGGPNEAKGLAAMNTFLSASNLRGNVYGHETPLTQVITDAKEYLQ